MGNERVMTDHEHEWQTRYTKRPYADGVEWFCAACGISLDWPTAKKWVNEHAKLKRDIAAKEDIIQVMEGDIVCVPKGQNVTEYVAALKRESEGEKERANRWFLRWEMAYDILDNTQRRQYDEELCALEDTQEKELTDE